MVFAVYQDKYLPNPAFLHDDLSKSFGKTLERSGMGSREENNQRRRRLEFAISWAVDWLELPLLMLLLFRPPMKKA